MADYRLNVIFHGPFIFAIYDDHVEALSPYIEGHDFGAGSWQMEQPCCAGTYTLGGISKQDCEMQAPDASTHVILDPNNLNDLKIPKNADYRFVLTPKPCSMTALGLITPGGALFSDNSGKITLPPQVGSAHFFSYIMGENDKPALCLDDGTFDWPPMWKQVTHDQRAVNLHIFSESALDMGVLHLKEVFSKFKTMLGVALVLVDKIPEVDFGLNLDVRSQGIDDEEQGGLRGLPSPVQLTPIGERSPKYGLLVPPRICDSPSMVVINADAALRS